MFSPRPKALYEESNSDFFPQAELLKLFDTPPDYSADNPSTAALLEPPKKRRGSKVKIPSPTQLCHEAFSKNDVAKLYAIISETRSSELHLADEFNRLYTLLQQKTGSDLRGLSATMLQQATAFLYFLQCRLQYALKAEIRRHDVNIRDCMKLPFPVTETQPLWQRYGEVMRHIQDILTVQERLKLTPAKPADDAAQPELPVAE